MSGHRIGTDMLLAHSSGALKLKDPGNAGKIVCQESPQFVSLVTSGAETRTLADPVGPGQRLTLGFKTDNGDCVITADSAINQAGNTVMTFADAGDVIELVGVEDGASLQWRVLANDGVALS